MDALRDQLACPVCLEIPESQIFICKNGHNVCLNCSTNLQICPQCRVSFYEGRTRNLAVEGIIDSLKIECPNKEVGCKEKFLEEKQEQHTDLCKYGGDRLSLCGIMGLDCLRKIGCRNTDNIIEHLAMYHNIIVENGSKCVVRLQKFSPPLWLSSQSSHNKYCMWSPLILTLEGARFLIFAIVNCETDVMSWFCILLGDSVDDTRNFKMEFHIEAKKENYQDLSWKVNPIPMVHMDNYIQFPPYQIPNKLLINGYMSEENVYVNISVVHSNFESFFTFGSSVTAATVKEITSTILFIKPPGLQNLFERITAMALKRPLWKPASSGRVAKGTLVACRQDNRNVYVIKAWISEFDKKFKFTGCLEHGDTNAFVTYKGKAYPTDYYEVLCISSTAVVWSFKSKWGSVVPPNAIDAGDGPEGQFYIGKVDLNKEGKETIGRISPKDGLCYIVEKNPNCPENCRVLQTAEFRYLLTK